MTSQSFLNIFTKDVPLKIFALFVAVLLWAGINFWGSQTLTVENITPDVVNMPSGLGLGENLPTVNVRVRAPRNVSAAQGGNKLVRVFVDLRGSGIGERITAVSVTTQTPNTEVVSVSPSSITVTLDPIVEREVPLRVLPQGNPTEGYRVGSVTITPEKIKVRGPLGVFRSMSSGIDAKINVEGAKDSFETEAVVDLPSGTQAVDISRIMAKVTMEHSQETKNVGIRVRTQGTPADGYFIRSITTTPSNVTIKGLNEVLGQIATIDTEIVDITNANSTREVNLRLVLPNGVAVTAGEESVNARIDIVPLEGTKQLNAEVIVRDVADGLRTSSVSPNSIKVSIRGNNVQGLKDEDVRVIISASGRNEGTFSVKAKVEDVQTPGRTQAVSVDQRDISVRLESI